MPSGLTLIESRRSGWTCCETAPAGASWAEATEAIERTAGTTAAAANRANMISNLLFGLREQEIASGVPATRQSKYPANSTLLNLRREHPATVSPSPRLHHTRLDANAHVVVGRLAVDRAHVGLTDEPAAALG